MLSSPLQFGLPVDVSPLLSCFGGLGFLPLRVGSNQLCQGKTVPARNVSSGCVSERLLTATSSYVFMMTYLGAADVPGRHVLRAAYTRNNHFDTTLSWVWRLCELYGQAYYSAGSPSDIIPAMAIQLFNPAGTHGLGAQKWTHNR